MTDRELNARHREFQVLATYEEVLTSGLQATSPIQFTLSGRELVANLPTPRSVAAVRGRHRATGIRSGAKSRPSRRATRYSRA